MVIPNGEFPVDGHINSFLLTVHSHQCIAFLSCSCQLGRWVFVLLSIFMKKTGKMVNPQLCGYSKLRCFFSTNWSEVLEKKRLNSPTSHHPLIFGYLFLFEKKEYVVFFFGRARWAYIVCPDLPERKQQRWDFFASNLLQKRILGDLCSESPTR